MRVIWREMEIEGESEVSNKSYMERYGDRGRE